MRKIIVILLTIYLGGYSSNFAQSTKEIKQKLLSASSYHPLIDFSYNLKPGEVYKTSVVLSKDTHYGFFFYQKEQNQLMFLIDEENDNSLEGGSIFARPGVHESEFTCKKTGVYHIKIQNISNQPLESVCLLVLKKRSGVSDTTYYSDEKSLNDSTNKSVKEEKNYYFIVDNLPKFIGEIKSFNKYLEKEIQYPQEAKDKNIEGTVYVQFIVSKEGYIKNAKVVRNSDPALDQEALRIVYSSPKWQPGIKNGNPVDVILTYPVVFKLP